MTLRDIILAKKFGGVATGNQDITTLDEYNVKTKATARVSAAERAKFLESNIRENVTLLGKTGTLVELNADTATVTPSTSEQTVRPTAPKNGFSSVTVEAMPVGSATTPATAVTANPTITVDSQTGAISASVSKTESVTPTVVPGYVASGTSGNVTVSGSASEQLSTQAAAVITPTGSAQTAVAAGKYTLGAVTVEGVICQNLTAANIAKDVVVKVGTATDDDSVISVTGEYEGGDVSYAELLTDTYGSGTPTPSSYKYVEVVQLSASQNDTYNAPDNTAYDPVVVSVAGGGYDHTFDVPTVSGSYTYNGSAQTPTIAGYYSDFMTMTGDTSETNAGSYSVTIALKDTTNCEWRDTTTTAKTLSWSIAKAALPKPTLSSAAISLNSDNLTGTFTVTRSGDGVISATSADTSKVTASVSGDTVTVTLVDTTAIGSTVNVTVTVAEGTNYLAYSATDVVCAVAITETVPQGYIVFESEDNTQITVGKNGGKTWNGTVYYSTDGDTWAEWDGVTSISGLKVYLRGVGNTKITGSGLNKEFLLNGTNITCIGRIDALLDYTETLQGNFPQMASHCYYRLFQQCGSLISSPILPAITLAEHCYDTMFYNCSSLKVLPSLPATILPNHCYYNMFYNCTSIKLSSTQAEEYINEYRIPTSGIGSIGTQSLDNMFTSTGGTFTGTPTINTTYYTSNTVV